MAIIKWLPTSEVNAITFNEGWNGLPIIIGICVNVMTIVGWNEYRDDRIGHRPK